MFLVVCHSWITPFFDLGSSPLAVKAIVSLLGDRLPHDSGASRPIVVIDGRRAGELVAALGLLHMQLRKPERPHRIPQELLGGSEQWVGMHY